MASSTAPRVQHFQLVDGMQLQINVSGCLNQHDVRIELQLKKCTRVWILHWGCIYPGNPNWFIPTDPSSGTKSYKPGALQTPFTKVRELYVVNIQLRDPKFHAIEFVLKDGGSNRWMKLNNGNFRIELPENDESTIHPSISKDLIEQKAYLIWESKGRAMSTPEQQKQNYDDAIRELQSQLNNGVSLNEVQSSCMSSSAKTLTDGRVQSSSAPFSYCRRHNVDQWLHKDSGHAKSMKKPGSDFMDLVERTTGSDKGVTKQQYNVGNIEIVVLAKITKSEHHILVAINTKGSIVLHWGVSKSSPGEWLVPPLDILPERSKLLPGACQTYFTEVSTGTGSFQLVDINLQQRNFLGIQFVIWTGGSWIKNNGENFLVFLTSVNPNGKVDRHGKEIVKWLLDEIYQREKEAERSLMHRFSIAKELTERCQFEGQLGLIGILVWLRFMACRHLTWNKNYNVKPREISEAQDKITNLLQKIYLNQPMDREIVRLIMLCLGHGGQGDLGQRIRDEILVIQDIANRITSFYKSVIGGDFTKLRAIQDAIEHMSAPSSLAFELKSKMRSSRIPWPGDESEGRWTHAWQAIKKVWASKWNERAYVSCRKLNLNHDNLRMSVLIQEVIRGDYAFVIHTKNPISGDTSEIYTEIVKGLGETLVGAYPGRAMSFITKKSNLKFPIVTGYPSKNIGLYSKQSIIFRSDSNGEDLEGYAGAGLYDSVLMDEEEKVVLDYSSDRMIVDNAFQISLFSKIAEAGKIIEGLYGCPQDVEGVVKDGVIYVVQARPQV